MAGIRAESIWDWLTRAGKALVDADELKVMLENSLACAARSFGVLRRFRKGGWAGGDVIIGFFRLEGRCGCKRFDG